MTGKTSAGKRHNILGVDFDLVGYGWALGAIKKWRQAGKRTYMSITNPHSVLVCHRDERMRRATAGAGMTLPDGVGIILAANLLGYNNSGRVTGPALMLKLCDWGREQGFRHFFYGGLPGVADKLADSLTQMYPGLQVTGTYCPTFGQISQQQDHQIVEKINRTRPDIVWVGLGAPKQEIWMADHLGRIDATVMIGVGAAFDFHSGSVKWAPGWMRKSGLEWAYRLTKEPKRMWRRNLDSPLFLAKVIWQRLSLSQD